MPTEEELSQLSTDSGEVSRDDLIAAVREAGGTESADVAAEEAAAAERASAAGSAPATETPAAPDPDEKLAAVLKAREEAHRKRLDAEERAAEIRRAAEEERQRILEEAKAEARRLADQELAELRAKFRGSPTAALRALADDPQEVVDAVLREGTPEARALAKAQEEARQARELAQAGKSAKEELDKFKAELAREKHEMHVAKVREDFLTNFASPEKAPYLHARFDADEVFERCDKLCREWQSDGLKLGVDFDRDTLVAYLEKQSRERLTKLSGSPAHQVSAAAPSKGPGIATKVAANGTRTLSAAEGSERRTSPKPLSEMSDAERRQALIEEVAAARRANPDASF